MNQAALTFDDGPSQWTLPILDLLKQHHAHATFFVLGTNLDEHADTVKRAAAEGHELGVHGWDHTPVDAMTTLQVQEALLGTYGRIKRLTGLSAKRWRPPWYIVTPAAAEVAEAIGLSYCGVTVDGYDVTRNDLAIVKTLYEQLAAGAIIGLHDGVANNGNQQTPHRLNTVRALERFLNTMNGTWDFVTVSELLG